MIAAMNEEENIPHVFARLPEGLHEVIVALDADGSMDAAEIPRFVAALCTGATS